MNAEEGSLGSIETACAFSGVSSVGLCPKKGGGSGPTGILRIFWYGIIWGNTVRVLREREACENTVGLSMSDGPIETVKYIWLNI